MSNRNRSAGHHFELDVIRDLKVRGWKAISSRYESRSLDDQGVDVVSDFPFQIQCKASINQPNVADLLSTTAADVILYRRMVKKGTRFYRVGEFALLSQEDFLNLVNKAYKNNKL